MTADPASVVVFNHIPKSAGTSVRERLQAALNPQKSIYYLDQSLVGGYDDFSQIDDRMRSGFVFDPSELPDADFVSGHIAPGTTQPRYPGARHVTVLRNPQARVISQWVHGRSVTDLELRHWGPGYAFRVARWPLARYLDHAMIAPNIDNTIARFLTWPHPALRPDAFIDTADDEALLDAALARLATFTHVDVVENRGFMDDLGASLGVQVVAERLNDRSAYPPVVATDLASELDAATQELLDHRTRLDRRIWEHVARPILPDADLDAILAAGMADSIKRYSALPPAPPRGGLKRRLGERAYRLKSRLDPRLRGYR